MAPAPADANNAATNTAMDATALLDFEVQVVMNSPFKYLDTAPTELCSKSCANYKSPRVSSKKAIPVDEMHSNDPHALVKIADIG
jgi:hypothetical protein